MKLSSMNPVLGFSVSPHVSDGVLVLSLIFRDQELIVNCFVCVPHTPGSE